MIIVEEYEGQKIDDIKRYGVDIFTVGSDWKGKFDYLQEYCKVVYLERTTGVSSTDIRAEKGELRIGIVGESRIINKFEKESHYVNGVIISGIYSEDYSSLTSELKAMARETATYQELLDKSDAVYIISQPTKHYQQVKEALLKGRHVLCESPIALQESQLDELRGIASEKGLVLSDGIKTAYSTAYNRMLLLVKSGVIGTPVSVDAVCTSLSDLEGRDPKHLTHKWNSICAWGPTALLPILQILGTEYSTFQIASQLLKEDFDAFTKVTFVYPHAVASIKVGVGVKSEGELTVSGTKGYVYVPAPWWKTDYFEIRYENPADNRRYYYQLDGEGIRYEIVSFLKAIQTGKDFTYIETKHSDAIVRVIEAFYQHQFIEL